MEVFLAVLVLPGLPRDGLGVLGLLEVSVVDDHEGGDESEEDGGDADSEDVVSSLAFCSSCSSDLINSFQVRTEDMVVSRMCVPPGNSY